MKQRTLKKTGRNKCNDRQGRWRNKIVSFRVSPEEADLLDKKVALSGISKQDYIINSILDKEIIVEGNPYVFRSLHDELERFIRLYGKKISVDDQELMEWVLKIMMVMEQEKRAKVKGTNRGPRQ